MNSSLKVDLVEKALDPALQLAKLPKSHSILWKNDPYKFVCRLLFDLYIL